MCPEMVAGRYFLAFDHQHRFEQLVRSSGSTFAPRASIVDVKEMIFDAAEIAAAQFPVSRIGIVVDHAYRGEIPRRARELGVTLAMSVESPNRAVFEFEHGRAFREQILALDPDITKAAIRHNVEGDQHALKLQKTRLRALSTWLATVDREFLLTLHVPATPQQMRRVDGDLGRFARDVRPELVCKAIEDLQSAGVEPTTWKVECLHTVAGAAAVAASARRCGRSTVDCVLLSAGERISEMNRYLRLASPIEGFVGFSIGRSIWDSPVRRYLLGELSREAAANEIAAAYGRFVDVFADPRTVVIC